MENLFLGALACFVVVVLGASSVATVYLILPTAKAGGFSAQRRLLSRATD